jgi:NitT/TauT family transport system substrate-binding protein
VPEPLRREDRESEHMIKRITRRTILKTTAGAVLAGTALGRPRSARAATKIRFVTNFYAEQAHGGNYQALATGLYERAGLDVTIVQGGPQINAMQLMLGGNVDIIMGKCTTVLNGVENDVPTITVAASYQWELQGLMTHADVNALADIKTRKVMMTTSGRTNYWPWLKKKYGFTDDQAMPYTNNLQPFFVDNNISVAALASDEPYVATENKVPVKFFAFLKEGWPPYGAPLVTTQDFLGKNRGAVAAFVRASLEGWKSYMANPAPGNALIKAENPKMSDGEIDFGVRVFKDLKVIEGGDAATLGIGIMTDARWREIRDFMVEAQLLKAATDWKAAYTTEFVKDLRIMM